MGSDKGETHLFDCLYKPDSFQSSILQENGEYPYDVPMILQYVDVVAKSDTACKNEVANVPNVDFDSSTMFCASNPVIMSFFIFVLDIISSAYL